jgi:prepilin-type N-terminal cleavage/methylation domain-containing protein
MSRHVPSRAAAGFTLVELLIVMAIVAILAAMGIAGYRHARVTAAEGVAIAALQAINRAQFAFSQTCGNQKYSPTLAGLAVPHPQTGAAFLSPDMAMDPVQKSGYTFTMDGPPPDDLMVQSCNGLVPIALYRVVADPTIPGATGIRYFATNSDRVIFADLASYAEDMPHTGAPGHGSEIK